jgi:hypothetical protein
MNSPSPADANADLDRDLESLRSLVNSFRPLRSLNLVEKKEQMRSESDKKFKELLRTQGARLFLTELRAVMRLIHELNLDDPDQRLRAIKLLRPFELLAKKLEIEDDDLQGLWNSMHAAEVGEASDFKASTSSLFKELEELANPPAQLPPAEEIGAAESKAGS